ncbi:MAG TPA: TMEM175 family protein [Chloroflexota bacterium]|nr:TMEM175 family protein [Chloroflexota bacterium]
MSTLYNRFAGQSLERLGALSDGVFAIAMTLLVLDLRVSAKEAVHYGDLAGALATLSPNLIAYFMSFLTLGIFWVGQQTQLNNFARSDRDLTWIHLGFLLTVSLMPFSTGLLARFIDYRLALVVYWLNILLLGAVLFASLRYASHKGLLKSEVSEEMRSAAERRIVVAQALYAFGALLCIISTHLSIAVIVLVQLNYAIAPRVRALYRL